MNAWCHIWIRARHARMGHAICVWGMSRANHQRHIVVSHVPHECVMSRVNASHTTYPRVMSHTNESCHMRVSHVNTINASCHIWMRASHKRTSHATCVWFLSHTIESCRVWMRHVTYKGAPITNGSCHTCMRHVTSRTNKLWHVWVSPVTYECFMSHINAHQSSKNEWRHVYMSRVTSLRIYICIYIYIYIDI